jgi:hypothetical protein
MRHLSKIGIAVIILVCVYAGGYFTAVKRLTKPQAPASHTETASATVEVIKEVFNCPNGALSSRESVKKIDTNINTVIAPPIIVKPDNLLFSASNKLHFEVMVNISELPLVPPHTWVGYAKDLRTSEDIYKIGYSTRIF